MMVIDNDYDVLGEEDDDNSIVASQVNDTDFKAISHKDALAALRASDKVSRLSRHRECKLSGCRLCVCCVRTQSF